MMTVSREFCEQSLWQGSVGGINRRMGMEAEYYSGTENGFDRDGAALM